jgi:hypothetical protein
MRNVLCGLAAALLSACGSSGSGATDVARNFVGTWNGTTTLVVNGQSQAGGSILLAISETGSNALTIGAICPDLLNSSGPPATADTATAFTMHAYACPVTGGGACSTIVENITDGSGSLSGTTLAGAYSKTQTSDSNPLVTATVRFRLTKGVP